MPTVSSCFGMVGSPTDVLDSDFIQELASGTFGAAAANVAPDAVQLGNGYEGILEEFYDDLQPLTYNTVYMTAPGNHEASCDGGKGTIAGQTYNTSFCPEGQKNFTGKSFVYAIDICANINLFRVQ